MTITLPLPIPILIAQVFSVISLIISLVLLIKLVQNSQQAIKIAEPFNQFLYRQKKVLIAWCASFIMCCITLAYLLIPTPTVIFPQLPLFDPLSLSPDTPLIIRFDRPISQVLTSTITPSLEGNWQYKSSYYPPPLKDTLIFTPHVSMLPQTEYAFSLSPILPVTWILKSQADTTLFVIKSPQVPTIVTSQPPNQSQDIALDSHINFGLAHPNPDSVNWSFESTPTFNGQISLSDQKDTLTIIPELALLPNTTHQISLYAQPLQTRFSDNSVIITQHKQNMGEYEFKTTSLASIKSISPQGSNVLPQESITIKFINNMDRIMTQNAFALKPATPGMFRWQDNTTLQFVPDQPWSIDTTYQVHIGTTAKTLAGGPLDNPLNHQFHTVGELGIINTTPVNGTNTHSARDPVSITFNQPVDAQSIEQKWTITPQLPGKFTWQENTLSFTPNSPFTANNSYQIAIAPGVKVTYGKPNTQTLTTSFSIVPDTFEIEVPLVKQQHTFTCYSAASLMVLQYRNINQFTELNFLDQIGFDTTTRNFSANSWGNPNSGIVGTYDGSGSGGYGVHWQPVANAISKYRPVEVKQNWNIPELLGEVVSGNPVMVWWVNGVWPAKDVSWNLPSGEKVYTVNGMHVEVVRGFLGHKDNPTYILTNDPWRGKRQYTPEQFANLWKWFNNTAIVVK